MTATYGAIGRIDYGSRTNCTIPTPAGVADGNFLLMVCITANSGGTAVTQTIPSGWTQLGTDMTEADAGNFAFRATVSWRIASSEPGSYTVNHASSNSEGLIMSITGSGTLSLSGSPNFSQAVNLSDGSTTTTATAVSPDVSDALLVFFGLNWDEVALTPPTGMTERQDAQFLYVATQLLSASGSTGTRTQTHGSNPWFGALVAVKDVTSSNKTLATDSATFTWSGTAANLLRGREIATDSATYTWSGTAANLERGYEIATDSASWAWTGTAATLRANRDIAADSATWTWTGTAASLEHGWELATDSATFTWSATAATLRANRDLATDAASWTWTGTAATLRANRDLATDAASFVWSGTDVTLTKSTLSNFTLSTDSAAWVWTGTAATLRANRDLPTDSASFAWSATDASLEHGREIATDSASWSWSATAASLELGRELATDAASWSWSGTDAGLVKSGNKILDASGAASWLWTGTAADLEIASAQTLDGSGVGRFKGKPSKPTSIDKLYREHRFDRPEKKKKKKDEINLDKPSGLDEIKTSVKSFAELKALLPRVEPVVAPYDDEEEAAALLLLQD